MEVDNEEGTCWFCGTRPAGGMYVDHVVWVRAPADYQGGSGTTVWDERGVMVGRCEICRDRHARLDVLTKVLWGMAALGLVGYLFVDDQWDRTATPFYVAAGLVGTVVATRMLVSAFYRLCHTRARSAANKHPEVGQFLRRGAKLGRARKSQ